jgi:hypothetical protein
VIDDPVECLERAQECLRLAETTADEKGKAYLYRLAAAWLKAASGDFEEIKKLVS